MVKMALLAKKFVADLVCITPKSSFWSVHCKWNIRLISFILSMTCQGKTFFNLLVNGPIKTSRERLKNLLEVESLAKQLAEDELGLHRGFPPHIDEVVKGKNILLWERLLQKHHYPDMQVVDFMKNGVDLVGEHSVSPIYPEQRVVATTSVELLKKSSTWRNQSFAPSTKMNLVSLRSCGK